MWRITSINNSTHEISIGHPDGDSHSFIVPHDQTERSKKLAYIDGVMTDRETRRQVKRNQTQSKTLKIIVFIESALIVSALIGYLWLRVI